MDSHREVSVASEACIDTKPCCSILGDGGEVLAEATVFKLVTGSCPPRSTALGAVEREHGYCGGLVNEHKAQFVRYKSAGRAPYALIVYPRESAKPALVVPIDATSTLSPGSVAALHKELLTIKPDGESVLKTILNGDGQDQHLFMFEVTHPEPNKLLSVLGIKPSPHAAIGFKERNEAAAWYLAIATAIGMVQQSDPLWKAVNKHWFAGHAAARLELSWLPVV